MASVPLTVLAVFPALIVVALFDVPLHSDLSTLLIMAAIFQLSAMAFGMLVAAVTRTTQQALLLAFFGLFQIPFLSGRKTPIESMPPVPQWLSRLSPLRYYMEILQGVFLKGSRRRITDAKVLSGCAVQPGRPSSSRWSPCQWAAQ